MHNDFLKDLEFLGVTARLKRLSDSLSAAIRELYRSRNVDIEPSWHLVFLYLKRNDTGSMTDLADAFRMSQPAMTKMIRSMTKRGYIEVARDEHDNRRKLLRLSKKAKKRLPEFEYIWNAGQRSIRDLLKSNKEFLADLDKFEAALNDGGFSERALKHLAKK